MAQTLAFVQEHEYASASDLETALANATAKTASTRKELKDTERRIADINKQIRLTGQYLANRDIYTEYRKTGKSQKFYEEHRAKLTLYETARNNLRELNGGQKIPSMKSLKEEKERWTALKNAQYEAYQNARIEQKDLQTIFANVQSMLGLDKDRATARGQKQHNHDIS